MENPVKIDDLGKTHYFRKHPYFASYFFLGGKQKPIKPDVQKAQSAMGSQWPPATPARPSADASGEPAGQVLSALPTQTKSEVTWSEQKPGCLGYTWMSQEVTKCKWLL